MVGDRYSRVCILADGDRFAFRIIHFQDLTQSEFYRRRMEGP